MIVTESLSPLNPDQRVVNNDRHYQLRLRLRIPADYRHDPILSVLITEYGLTVNILAAQLSNHASDGGWFDLELNGPVSQINNGILYLNDLGIEIWHESESHHDSW